MVGREEDVANLRTLLTRQQPSEQPGMVLLDARRVKEARGKKHNETTGASWTQEDLAKKAGHSKETIVRKAEGEKVERDDRFVTRRTAADIATALGVELDYLLEQPDVSAGKRLTVMHGLPGVGKTTLAAALAHDRELSYSFPGPPQVLWASLGQKPDVMGVLIGWGEVLGVGGLATLLANQRGRTEAGEAENKDLETAGWRISAALRDRRTLLIIDDAWQPEAARALMLGGPLCSTLVTTRVTGVADDLESSGALYPLKILREGDAVELLKRLAPESITNKGEEAEALELVNALECLPLALQVAGKLLRVERRNQLGLGRLLQELQDAARILKEKPPSNMAVGLDGNLTVEALFRKSTDVLDDVARKCFAYLAPSAPKPAHFDLGAMEAVWEPIGVDVRQMAEHLIARGLMEPMGEGRFWMHALLVAHANSLLMSNYLSKPAVPGSATVAVGGPLPNRGQGRGSRRERVAD